MLGLKLIHVNKRGHRWVITMQNTILGMLSFQAINDSVICFFDHIQFIKIMSFQILGESYGTMLVNSLAPGRCGNNYVNIIF